MELTFDQIVWYGAIITSAIFIIQFIMSFFADMDFDADFDADGGLDSSDVFSFKGLLHFLLGFCWTCVLYGTDAAWKIGLAVVVGIIFLVSLIFVYKKLYSLAQEKKFQNPVELIGTEIEVYTFYEGMGSALVSFDGRRTEITIKSETPLKSGDTVVIVDFQNNVYTVEPQKKLKESESEPIDLASNKRPEVNYEQIISNNNKQ